MNKYESSNSGQGDTGELNPWNIDGGNHSADPEWGADVPDIFNEPEKAPQEPDDPGDPGTSPEPFDPKPEPEPFDPKPEPEPTPEPTLSEYPYEDAPQGEAGASAPTESEGVSGEDFQSIAEASDAAEPEGTAEGDFEH